MSKKHFELLAKQISVIYDPNIRRDVARLIALACAESNDRFDRARFMRACDAEAVTPSK
jgi:hypothetical protein